MRSIKSLEKGLQILEAISRFPDGARVKEINKEIPESVSNMTLFLNSLILSGFVTKEESSGRYCVSRKVAEIAEKSDRAQYSLLREAAVEQMQRLCEEFNENVLLAVLDGHDIHFIERLQSNRAVQILQTEGTHYPPHVSAGGKAILAFLPPEGISAYLETGLYHRFTEKSLINPKMLKEELDWIKTAGYAVNRGEFETEIMAVAAPLLVSELPLGSLVVQFPTFRYSEGDLPAFGERIKRAAVIVAQVLGSTD